MGKCAAGIKHWYLALVEISRKGDISNLDAKGYLDDLPRKLIQFSDCLDSSLCVGSEF